MRLRVRTFLALGAGLLVLGACAPGAGDTGPVTSPTGRVYEPGTAPSQTRQSTAATLAVAQGDYEEALAQAQQGIAADSANPVHYYLAGQAYVGLGDYELADEMFRRAEEIYPAYELEVEPDREAAWEIALQQGAEAYEAGNMEEAIRWWDRANLIYDVHPGAYMNLAIAHTQQNDYDRAIEAYRGALAALERQPATRTLEEEELASRAESRATVLGRLADLLTVTEQFAEAEQLYREQLEANPEDPELLSGLALALARQGREAEAQEIYERVLADPSLEAPDLFNIGVALFHAEAYEQAAEAFRRVTEARPNSRDAWSNYATALYAGGEYEALLPVAERLVELDPLNLTAAQMLSQAHREAGNPNRALEALQRVENQPVQLENLQMQPRRGATRVSGEVIGKQASAGTPVQIRFIFYGADGSELGRETVTVNAPAPDQRGTFEVVLQAEEPAGAYRYELAG